MREYNVAVLGATGLVGRSMIEILESRKFPIRNFYPLASSRSAGEPVLYAGKPYTVLDAADFDFSEVDIALFSAGGAISAQYAPIATAAGAVVIDNTSHYRYEKDIPLVVAEVNPEALEAFSTRNIIANPNCSTMQMLVALKPIYDAVGIKRINVATYQSVSGSGQKGVDELVSQCAELLNGRSVKPEFYPYQIAFNVIPQIDIWMDNGFTKEEMKMVWETQKILDDDSILVNPTCVRVPVFFGHAEAVHLETEKKISVEEVKKLLKRAPGVTLIDKQTAKGFPTPISHAAGNDPVYVGRIREDLSHPLGLNLWIVADNIRKGAALNAVQIAEILIEKYL